MPVLRIDDVMMGIKAGVGQPWIQKPGICEDAGLLG
jgi:hypothetical protein